MVAKHEFKAPESLTDLELVEAFDKLSQIKDWLNGAKDYMLAEALRGRDWPGLKPVRGTSKRRWIDQKAVIAKLRKLKIKKTEYIKQTLRGLKDVGDLMTKDDFDKHFKALIVKPEGAPTLVPHDDPRKDIRQTAVDDFAAPVISKISNKK